MSSGFAAVAQTLPFAMSAVVIFWLILGHQMPVQHHATIVAGLFAYALFALFFGVGLVMTKGPAARIGQILDIDLPRPRDRVALALDARYTALRGEVLEFLYRRHAHVEASA